MNEILSNLKARLTEIYRDRLDCVCLFGSHARGDADAESDIDLLVVLKGEVNPNKERARTLDIVSELSLEHNVVISCLFTDSQSFANKQGPLFRNVRKEGVLL